MGDVAAVGCFSPAVTNLRGLQQATTLGRLGGRCTSLRVLSDVAYVFDAALLHEVITVLGAALDPHMQVVE